MYESTLVPEPPASIVALAPKQSAEADKIPTRSFNKSVVVQPKRKSKNEKTLQPPGATSAGAFIRPEDSRGDSIIRISSNYGGGYVGASKASNMSELFPQQPSSSMASSSSDYSQGSVDRDKKHFYLERETYASVGGGGVIRESK